MSLPKNIKHLSDLLSSMPGIGPKLSNRLALFLALDGKGLSTALSKVLLDVVENTKQCIVCGNVTTEDLCYICKDSTRNRSQIVLVEDAIDLENINSTGEYRGVFHVLNGLISPVNGVGPEDINISGLLKRISENNVEELIFALNPNIEGEATSLYVKHQIENLNSTVKLSRLAKGIPSGSDIEFASQQTLLDSLKSRINF